MKEIFFFHFFSKKTSNIISKFNDDFSENFFEVLHISVKILGTRPDFLTFSAKTHKRFENVNFELQKWYIPQNNPQKNRHNSHV